MNFDMLPDYTMTLFISIVLSIFLILIAQFIRTCFDCLGPSDEKRNYDLLEEPFDNGQFCTCCTEPVENPNFPSPVPISDPLNDAISDISDTSDSSYYPETPNASDSNCEDTHVDSIWVRRRRRPRLERVHVAPFFENNLDELPFQA
jgi:hypothetical protein